MKVWQLDARHNTSTLKAKQLNEIHLFTFFIYTLTKCHLEAVHCKWEKFKQTIATVLHEAVKQLSFKPTVADIWVDYGFNTNNGYTPLLDTRKVLRVI